MERIVELPAAAMSDRSRVLALLQQPGVDFVAMKCDDARFAGYDGWLPTIGWAPVDFGGRTTRQAYCLFRPATSAYR